MNAPPILQLLSTHGVDHKAEGQHHHSRPGWIQMDCPDCGPNTRKYHLGFHIRSQFFNCWKCGRKNGYKILLGFGVPISEVKAFFGNRAAGTSPEAAHRGRLVEPKHREGLMESHADYLRARGFEPDEIVRLWEVEGFGHLGRLSWRIYIPIVQHGRRVSWTTRAIGEQVAQRYVSASAAEESVNHKHVIYGGDYCGHSIVIVEGPIDAWRVGPGAGALFGTGFSSAQVARLARFPYRFVCFDRSPEAQARAAKLCCQLSCFPGTTERIELDADDPGSASRSEIKILRRAAMLD